VAASIKQLLSRLPRRASRQARADHELAQRAQAMAAEGGFLGVPLEGFAQTGRTQLDALLTLGLSSDSKLLDIGCGCLRGGYWLIHFLAPGRYFGIEPHRHRVELGLRYLLEPEVQAEKRPRFDHNDTFDTSVFGERFDFFLAGSIWSHASKPQVERTLDGFVRDTTDGAVFMASYVPATRPEDEYGGREWVGTSHTCDVPGVISHSLGWIQQACSQRGLKVSELPGYELDAQPWLAVRRTPG
jgi:hypothetical protein